MGPRVPADHQPYLIWISISVKLSSILSKWCQEIILDHFMLLHLGLISETISLFSVPLDFMAAPLVVPALRKHTATVIWAHGLGDRCARVHVMRYYSLQMQWHGMVRNSFIVHYGGI